MASKPLVPRASGRHVSWRWLGAHLKRRVLRFTAGGGWTEQLPPALRDNLRWFWFDGVLAQASESVVVAYLPLYLLALGATAAHIGLLSALSNLSAAMLVLPGAAMVERWGYRKRICLWSGGGLARATLLGLALLPVLPRGPAVIYMAIALAVARVALGHLSLPAWTSLTADLVPLNWRGRYFASRNMAMGVAGMALTYGVGWLITRTGNLAGYPLAMGVALIAGLLSTGCFARIHDPDPRPLPAAGGRWSGLQELRAAPAFVVFCTIAGLWNLSLHIAGPFFSVYLVGNLKASAGFVGALAVINGLAALPGQRLFGFLSDRWGPHRVQWLTGLLIPLVPWLWALSRTPWQVIPAEIASGFLWAGYGLSSFNFLLALTPPDRRARYTALYQIVVTATLALGAAVGGVIATRWGYTTTFVVSGWGRLVAALLFVCFVRPPGQGFPAHSRKSS